MDTGNGILEIMRAENEDIAKQRGAMEKKHPNHGGWFREGELIEIRGSLFKITNIKPTKLTLKLQRRG